jgi:ElaB/YqjD/DUF883 family membrane-anchored ribosome-binding protein
MTERATVERSKPQASAASRLRERSRRLESDARSFAADVEELISDVEDLVRSRLETQPYATLAVAAGAGFVVGGGLTLGVLGTIVRAGVRAALGTLVQGAVARAVSASKTDDAST